MTGLRTGHVTLSVSGLFLYASTLVILDRPMHTTFYRREKLPLCSTFTSTARGRLLISTPQQQEHCSMYTPGLNYSGVGHQRHCYCL